MIFSLGLLSEYLLCLGPDAQAPNTYKEACVGVNVWLFHSKYLQAEKFYQAGQDQAAPFKYLIGRIARSYLAAGGGVRGPFQE